MGATADQQQVRRIELVEGAKTLDRDLEPIEPEAADRHRVLGAFAGRAGLATGAGVLAGIAAPHGEGASLHFEPLASNRFRSATRGASRGRVGASRRAGPIIRPRSTGLAQSAAGARASAGARGPTCQGARATVIAVRRALATGRKNRAPRPQDKDSAANRDGAQCTHASCEVTAHPRGGSRKFPNRLQGLTSPRVSQHQIGSHHDADYPPYTEIFLTSRSLGRAVLHGSVRTDTR